MFILIIAKQFFVLNKCEDKLKSICILCITELCQSLNHGTGNVTKSMVVHLESKAHKDNFGRFERESWRYPYLQHPLSFEQFSKLVDESAMREGKWCI